MPDAVTIPFVPDLSAVYAALGKLRSDAASPIGIGGLVGPGIGTPTGTASSASSGLGPATFANLRGDQVYTGIGISNLIGPGSGAGGLTGYHPAGSSNFTASFQPAISAMQQAANELRSAASALRGTMPANAGAMESITQNEAAAGPEIPGRRGGGRYGGLGFVRSPRGLMLNALSRFGSMTGTGMMGAVGGIGVGLAGMALYAEETERGQFAHQLTMAEMGGATQQDIMRMKLSQIQQFNRTGLGFAVTRASEWMADTLGINPGGRFTAVRDEERGISESIDAYNKRDFLHETNRINRGITSAIDEAAEVNPYARRRIGIRSAAREQALGYEERFNKEEEKYNDTNDPTGNYRRSLDKQKFDLIHRAGVQRDVELSGMDRDEGIMFRGRAISSEMSSIVSGYMQRHDGEGALYAELQGRQRAFRATEAQTYNLDTYEGRNARDKAYGAIGAGAGEQMQHMIDTGFTARARVGAENESLRARLSASSPAIGEATSNITSIMRNAELSAYGTSLRTDMRAADKTALERQQINQGQLQLQDFHRSIMASGHGKQLESINQIQLHGAGTIDLSELTAHFKSSAAELQSVNGNIGKLHDTLKQLVD